MACKCPKCLHHLFEMFSQWVCLLVRFIALAVAAEMCPESKSELVISIIITIISFILSIPQCKAICSKYPDGILGRCCKNTSDLLLLIIQLVLSLVATGVLISAFLFNNNSALSSTLDTFFSLSGIIMKKEQRHCELIPVKVAVVSTALSFCSTLNLCKIQFPNCFPSFEKEIKYSKLSTNDHHVNIDQH
ncbi:uncharacterized protein LOC130623538 isoform X1 [Hydractinia symbiolongicarpus]|uniref:uncharacterized protein LOC130623538 isoform X1 n=1 Tax=Hydractinia symbiolongicarpus TaxID=13093 RepID=UPI00254A530E|nr:uncharacterized protein LOC130623538 isoform X1 [Hydractinia symbiolongicarpus]XP_057295013.1 uncharacterized protein LOC130623538 isoform X1 [Hydractinia symbiolongicarpus]